ncbi:MAG: carbon monoxide dehydrogenase subunit G [Acetobacteraceae bacterium]|nr:carbon monoxide dehydrogenase subunit G [Acetobacteraceae bacterium]
MEMTGERRIPAPRQQVWDALNDPEVLRASIPGCESVERDGEDQFKAKVAVKLGPMSAKFTGKVRLENLNPPERYTIAGEGSGGAMGFAKGGADVALKEAGPAETLLNYNVKAQVGGKIAQLGGRLIDSTAKQMADQFFNRFTAHFDQPETEAAAPQPEGATAVGASTSAPGVSGMAQTNTDTEYLAHSQAAGPLTQHGADGPSASGKPVHRPNPRPVDTEALRPLRLLTTLQPFGLPLQFWLGGAALLVIAALMFL